MKKVNNDIFLNFFENEDLIRYYFDCENISSAGSEKTAVKSIEYYTESGKPDTEYISFCENIFDELIVEINTDNIDLIKDAFLYIKEIKKKYKKVKIGALSTELYNSNLFKKYFKTKKTYYADYGVFAQYSKNSLSTSQIPENVDILLVNNQDKVKFLEFDDDEWDGLASIMKYSLTHGSKNDMLFIIKENDAVCGYLTADCTYKNICNIGNVFVHSDFRDKGYGKILTIAFAEECYKNNLIPYYGTAVSEYSEAVALKCGFTEIFRHHYVDVKPRLFVR